MSRHPRSRRAPGLRLPLPALVLVLGACGPAPESTGPVPEVSSMEGPAAEAASAPRSGGTLVVGTSFDIAGVNELISATGRFSQDVIDRLFLHLFEEQDDFAEHPPTFAPQLAVGHEWSPDRLALTVRLRPGVRWSDGEPVTAEDVRWTWQMQTDPAIAWQQVRSKEAITDVEVVDPLTVRFRFSRASSNQLADVNEGVVLPRHAWSAVAPSEWRRSAAWFRDHLVTSGPFRLESWQPQQQIVLVRNEHYWEPDRPRIDRVVFRVIPDRGNQLRQLVAGELDYVLQIAPEETARIAAGPRTKLVRHSSRQYNFIAWNAADPLFADAEVRRAMTLAIDRQELVDALWFGHARVACSPILSTLWAFNRELAPWPYDPDEASRILADRGWRDRDGDGIREREGRSFSFTLLTNADNRLRVDAAVIAQQHLRWVGVEAEIQQLEFNTVVARSLSRDFQAVLSAWTIDTSLDLKYAFHSASIAQGGMNFGGYADPELDRLIDAARRQTDPEEMRRLLARAQEIVHRDQPYTFLWEPQQLNGASRRLRGIRSNALSSFFRLEDWWLAEGG